MEKRRRRKGLGENDDNYFRLLELEVQRKLKAQVME